MIGSKEIGLTAPAGVQRDRAVEDGLRPVVGIVVGHATGAAGPLG